MSCSEREKHSSSNGFQAGGAPDESVFVRLVLENDGPARVGSHHDIVFRASCQPERRNGANAPKALVRQDGLHFPGLVRSEQLNHLGERCRVTGWARGFARSTARTAPKRKGHCCATAATRRPETLSFRLPHKPHTPCRSLDSLSTLCRGPEVQRRIRVGLVDSAGCRRASRHLAPRNDDLTNRAIMKG